MAKFDYSAMYDPKNAFPKRLPNVSSEAAADKGVLVIGIPNDSTVAVDDAKEYWNGGNLMAVYGISVDIVYYARTGNLNQFLP